MSGLCTCRNGRHVPRLVVVTGGPGAGKTAALEVVRRTFCPHVAIVPEAASILFGGGFPRTGTPTGLKAAQCAIYHVQRQLERVVVERDPALVVCDRGGLDGAAYWPGPPGEFLAEAGTDLARELARYAAVLHLEPPPDGLGYDRSNPVRIESADQARKIDAKIAEVWKDHPRRRVVPATARFMEKVDAVLGLIAEELPACCKGRGAG